MLKGENHSLRILYSVKISYRNDQKLKKFLDKDNSGN